MSSKLNPCSHLDRGNYGKFPCSIKNYRAADYDRVFLNPVPGGRSPVTPYRNNSNYYTPTSLVIYLISVWN